MDATGWRAGTVYGIRVGRENANNYFSPKTPNIQVDIDGFFYNFRLTPTFWTTCPEIRGKAIREWFIIKRLAPWPKGETPKLTLKPLGDHCFKLAIRGDYLR